MDCPCGGEKSRTWHITRKLPMCDHVRAQRREKDQARTYVTTTEAMPACWVPGTSILVPEHEEP